jgi:hypothetical protein
MNTQENLKLIEQMLMTAKKEVNDNGFFFLLWGWLVFIASTGCFILDFVFHSPYAAWIWILMPVGSVISIIAARRMQKQEKVRTWADEIMKYIWTGFGATLLIALLLPAAGQGSSTYAMIIAVYGIGLYITGGLLRFRPLIAGGIICWVLAIVAIFVGPKYQLPLLSLSVLLGYIIPGYILRSQYKRNVQRA